MRCGTFSSPDLYPINASCDNQKLSPDIDCPRPLMGSVTTLVSLSLFPVAGWDLEIQGVGVVQMVGGGTGSGQSLVSFETLR